VTSQLGSLTRRREANNSRCPESGNRVIRLNGRHPSDSGVEMVSTRIGKVDRLGKPGRELMRCQMRELNRCTSVSAFQIKS
jgi:hypothetical protein